MAVFNYTMSIYRLILGKYGKYACDYDDYVIYIFIA